MMESIVKQEVALNICEVKVFTNPVTIVCYGLGSCIALFITDRKTRFSAGAHIMLPDETAVSDMCFTCFAKNAIDSILNQLKNLGSDLKSLRAKLVGGANFMNLTNSVGNDTLKIVFNDLVNRRIIISGMDVGGKISRTAKFNSESGVVTITSAHNSHYQLTL